MPKMEMAQESGTVLRWLKVEGSTVRKGEPLLEAETDKVTVEVESPGSGILTGVTAREGEEVPVGTVIAVIRSPEELEQMVIPADATASISQAAEVANVASPVAQRMAAEHHVDLSQIRVEGRRITRRDVEDFLAHARPSSQTVRLSPASPLARRLAGEIGVDVAAVHGSGPEGAVLATDVRAFRQASTAVQMEVQPAPEPTEPPSLPRAIVGSYRTIPLRGVRKVIAERLQHSFQTAPHIALTLSADMTEVKRLIEHLSESAVWQATGSKVSLTAVLARIGALALARHPRINAHLVDLEIREYDRVHLGIAVALDDGLIVPVIRDAQTKGLAVIQSELDDLVQRARSGRLKLEEVKGSTFTISNLGMFGIEQFTAVLNPPEVGLLTVGAITPSLVESGGQVTTRPLMRLTLMADHRAVDGGTGAQFLATVKAMVENPYLLLV